MSIYMHAFCMHLFVCCQHDPEYSQLQLHGWWHHYKKSKISLLYLRLTPYSSWTCNCDKQVWGWIFYTWDWWFNIPSAGWGSLIVCLPLSNNHGQNAMTNAIQVTTVHSWSVSYFKNGCDVITRLYNARQRFDHIFCTSTYIFPQTETECTF